MIRNINQLFRHLVKYRARDLFNYVCSLFGVVDRLRTEYHVLVKNGLHYVCVINRILLLVKRSVSDELIRVLGQLIEIIQKLAKAILVCSLRTKLN